MNALHEEPGVMSNEDKVFETLRNAAQAVEAELENCRPEIDEVIIEFTQGIISNKNVLMFGTKNYDAHMDQQRERAGTQRPFGVELDTLTQNVQLILYPGIIFPVDDTDPKLANDEGQEVHTDGPQAILYALDGIEKDVEDPQIAAANTIFIAFMTHALHTTAYPPQEEEQSDAFKSEVAKAIKAVKEYLAMLTEGKIANLPNRLKRIHELSDDKVPEYADEFVTFHAEAMKMPGLYIATDGERELPSDAIEKGTEYLHLSQRDLPQRKIDGPAYPWVEYATNTWNRSHKLFGRYEAQHNGSTTLRVDYMLDSTHFPLNYGFFSLLEINEISESNIAQHVIIGQDVKGFFEPFPAIVAGEFDFSNFDNVTRLMKLANDLNTKKEIAAVLQDILSQSGNGTLQRASDK